MRAFVDPDLCIGCTQCAGICPAGQDIHVQLRGGELVIRVLPGRQLLMTGSAVTVYEGVAEV